MEFNNLLSLIVLTYKMKNGTRSSFELVLIEKKTLSEMNNIFEKTSFFSNCDQRLISLL